jgi:L-threonylcarbamoyladenylate synthase
MRIPVTTDIAYAADIIRQGRVVAFPTGTAYGLAVDALQGFALQRLRNLKQRPEEKSFTVCIRPDLWDDFVQLSNVERQLMQALHGKSITMLVTAQKPLHHLAQAGRIGLRLVDHPLMQQFVESVSVPITATSANLSGQPSCFSPQAIETAFPLVADGTTYTLSLGAILDGGTLPERAASTIMCVNRDGATAEIVRVGVVSANELAPYLTSAGLRLG